MHRRFRGRGATRGRRDVAVSHHPARSEKSHWRDQRLLLGGHRGSVTFQASPVPRAGVGMAVVMDKAEVSMSILVDPLFWDKKIKIAVLTFATFAALC